jgi:5-methylcytosine-specific restriction endonuclease McrA
MGLVDDLVERDGSVCVWCGRAPWRRDLTAEHLLPRSRGGRTTPENLAVACRQCNRNRRSRGLCAYVRALERAGIRPRRDLLRDAAARLAASEHEPHARYGARQVTLLERLDPVSKAA